MKNALISVYEKTGLEKLAKTLTDHGWNILASGGTAKLLSSAGITVREVSDYTKSPEILSGRVKTLHPAIHGGILARGTEEDQLQLENLGFEMIDLVVVNLYPFEKTVAIPDVSEAEAIEQIDIGGVALLRAAAKNHDRVTVVSDPADYQVIIDIVEAGKEIPAELKKNFALKAFRQTASYDTAISGWLAKQLGGESSQSFTLKGYHAKTLRYGENPHQHAEYYSAEPGAGIFGGAVLQGKELSYNNILDLDAAWQAVSRFERPAVVIVKHLSPCGIAQAPLPKAGNASGNAAAAENAPDEAPLVSALTQAIACDPVSAFGGVIAVNREFSGECARNLGSLFVECIIAPAFSKAAIEILAKKKNLRLVVPGALKPQSEIRSVLGGFLRQDIDDGDPENTAWTVVTKRAPTAEETAALGFAWKACISVKSNAIVLANANATVGIGGGQPNRVDSVRIAVTRAGERAKGSVLASDAFFPFPDSVEEAAKAGVTAIIQPGGSIRDQEAIAAADSAGIAMVVTGVRHFRH